MKTSLEEIGAFDAKTHLSSLLEKVQQGKSFIITKRGKRIAELRPIRPSQNHSRTAGTLKGKISMAPNFDAPIEQFKNYMPSAKEAKK